MNTIPSIFNERIPTYTAVGGRERSSCGISAVILNRHGFPRRSFFQELEKTGFDNVISVESRAPNYNIEDLARRYPFIRFILPENEISLGEQINIAASEIDNPLFFVMRSDMKIIAGGYAGRMAERLSVKADNEEKNEHAEKDDKADAESDKKTIYKRLCTVPVIINSNYEALRSLVIPMTYKKKMRTIFMEPQKEGDFTLYPFEGIGIYDRRRFIGIGGFDTTLRHIHWQLMDFGFRAHLWGEEIALNLQVKLLYDGEIPGVDYSVDTYYRHFYLKNLAPVFKNDEAHLPYARFPDFALKSGEDVFTAWKEFKECRKWVINNKEKWKCDAHSVTSRWDNVSIPAQE